MLDTVELGLLKELSVAPIARAGSVSRSNLLCKMTKRQVPLAVYVSGTVGGRKAHAHIITPAGRVALGKAGL